MQVAEININKLDAAVVNYINELKINYEQQIANRNNEIIKIKNESIENYNKYLEYKEKYTLLVFKRFARSAEQLSNNENQMILFTNEAEPEKIIEQAEEETTKIKSYTRKKPGRKPIDPNIPRIPRNIEIPEDKRICACGAIMTKIGEVTSEKLEIIPPKIYVDEIHRFKYACRCCEGTEDEDESTVITAPAEPAMVPKGIASPSVLATIFTQKFEDHLPYYRQEKQFSRIGAKISRQDMSNWQQHVFNKLIPLLKLMKIILKSGPVIQMDETTVQVMGEEGRADTQKSYMWLARGGPPGKTITLFNYRETRAAKHAKEFLEGYSGYLQTDGYEGYNCAVKENPGIIHVGCFAHARRYFFEASKATKTPQSAIEGMKHIQKLYELERKLRNEMKEREETENKMSEEEFVEKRKAEAKPILEKFYSWLLKRKDEVNPTSLLGKAINYSLDEWDKLVRYLESAHLKPDNNACENAIRPFVLGRKNWLFCKSPEGAESSCGIYSLIETAKQNSVQPFTYLKILFEKAPYASTTEDWEKLLPWNIFTA